MSGALSMAEVTIGSRVLVTSNAGRWRGRTGLVVRREAGSEDVPPRWVVSFDWPLGGMASFGVFPAANLELRQDLPQISEPPR